jgi:ABC-type enterobactin transport system permease subunit
MCILYNQQDATYTVFFIIISAPHVSGGFSARHQELIKLCSLGYCHAFLLSAADVDGLELFSGRQQGSMTIPKAAHTVL